MGVRRLYVKSPNCLNTKQKTRVQKGREPCSKGMAFKLCLEEGQEEAKCRWKGIEDPHCKSRETASCLSVCTAAARGGSTALSREFGQILLQQVGNFAWEIWSPWMQWCCQVSEKVSLASSVGLPRRGRREGSPPRRECDENSSCP